jgi:hypothetical protein
MRNNCDFIPNFGERYRMGKRSARPSWNPPSTRGESTVRQETEDAVVNARRNLLLQTRTKVLNNELEEVFRGLYLRFRPQAA